MQTQGPFCPHCLQVISRVSVCRILPAGLRVVMITGCLGRFECQDSGLREKVLIVVIWDSGHFFVFPLWLDRFRCLEINNVINISNDVPGSDLALGSVDVFPVLPSADVGNEGSFLGGDQIGESRNETAVVGWQVNRIGSEPGCLEDRAEDPHRLLKFWPYDSPREAPRGGKGGDFSFRKSL